MRDDDQDLRDIFSAAREQERVRAPGFAVVMRKHRRRGSRVIQTSVVTALAAAAVIVAVYAALRSRVAIDTPRTPVLSVLVDPRSTHWESPTDFLLVTPADSLMRMMPTLHYLDRDIPSLAPSRPAPVPGTGRVKS